MKNLLKIALVIGLILGLLGPAPAQEKPLIVGGKNFTEQYILADMAKILLEQQGFQVNLKTGVGSTVLRRSLERGQVDLYFEYTGTAYTVYYNGTDRAIMTDPEKVFAFVKKADAQKGLVWLPRMQEVNSTYTLIMTRQQAQELNLSTISELASYVNQHPEELIFGMNAEFWGRPDGFRNLMKAYHFRVPPGNIRKMATGLTYTALKQGETDISMAFSTDGRILAWGFVELADDQKFFPVYNPAPVVRKPILAKYPQIEQILAPLNRLTTRDLQELNKAVDIDRKSVQSVARDWLKSQGLMK
jgi:osmoprotectant transport system substrate-binding protein